jgi:alpha,alpha-trehalase
MQSGQSTWDLIPSGQLGLNENQLPQQPTKVGNITNTGPSADINTGNGTVINGGNVTSGEGWGDMLQREVANRYITSAFCSWCVLESPDCAHFIDDITCRVATGGSIPGMVARLPPDVLNITQSVNNTGNVTCPYLIPPALLADS